MKQVILDTDTVSFFFRGNEKVIRNIDNYLTQFVNLNISIITYYEILNGLLFKDAKKQLNKFLEFTKYNKILPLTVLSVNNSANIYANLRKTGKVISHNDVLIAGIAITNNFVLITNNTYHFKRIKELEIDNWTT